MSPEVLHAILKMIIYPSIHESVMSYGSLYQPEMATLPHLCDILKFLPICLAKLETEGQETAASEEGSIVKESEGEIRMTVRCFIRPRYLVHQQ